MTTSNWGIPTETELEALANSMFPDLTPEVPQMSDIPGFDPQRCAAGIDALVTKGDPAVIYEAADKAEQYLGSSSFSYISEYEKLASDLFAAETGELQGFYGVTPEQAAVQPVSPSPSAAGYTPSTAGYTQSAASYAPSTAGYSQSAASYAPSTAGYSQSAASYAPSTAGYAQSAASYAPSTAGYAPSKTSYSPSVMSETQAAVQPQRTVNASTQVSAVQTASRTPANGNIVVGTKTLGQIRRDFPILNEVINGHPLVWLDNGATTQRPQAVIDRLSYYYAHENSNVHRGAHELAARSTDAYENARQITASFIGAPDKNNVVFVRGTTEGINLVANAYVKPLLQPGDEIILSILEHHANIVPWQLICEETGAVIKVIPCDESGQLILPEYEKLFTRRTKFVSVTQVSNVLGTVTPVEELIAIAHAHGVRILIDGAQSVAHIPVNVAAMDADFFVFSGHKIFAPTGIGALYGKPELLEAARPYHGGGNMIKDVTFERTIYNPAPNKFEAGTGSIADAVGLGAALEYLSSIGMPAVNKHEHELLQYAMSEMRKIPGLHLIGTAPAKASVLSFVLDTADNEAVGARLNELGIAVRTGHHCAQPVLRRFGLEGTVRPTLALYNSFEDIDALVQGIRTLA